MKSQDSEVTYDQDLKFKLFHNQCKWYGELINHAVRSEILANYW